MPVVSQGVSPGVSSPRDDFGEAGFERAEPFALYSFSLAVCILLCVVGGRYPLPNLIEKERIATAVVVMIVCFIAIILYLY
jgi:hypothetical protein